VIKPAWEGSSKGNPQQVPGGADPAAVPDVVNELRRDHPQTILLEEYIDGVEVTVGMLGNDPPQVLGVMSVEPNQVSESTSSTAWRSTATTAGW